MASSPQPPDLIEEPDNGLMFTILRRSSSTGSLQVPASSIGFDGFVATAVKSPSDPNSGQNPAVKGFIGLEPPKIDALVKSVPQVVNYKDAGGEAVNEVFTATAAHVDSITVQNLVTVEGSSTSETIQKTDVASSPSLGAWAKPLRIYPSSPSAVNVLHEAGSNLLQELSSPSHWPSLSAGQHRPAKNHTRAPQLTNRVTDKALVKPKQPAPEVNKDGNLRFPWAAKMNPSTRNLYRTTSPTYLEDGTPMVTIPSKLLLHGPENQKEYIIGQFHRCSIPSGGLVNAVVNRIWGKKCKIFSKKLGESSFLFHIPDESLRSWILQRGLWHVDDCLMFVAPWSPAASLSLPEISTIPVWVTLKNIPSRLYSTPGISRIASALGAPMLTNKPRLDPTLMGEAKILVEVELDKQFPQKIALNDKRGTISLVEVEYSWIPTMCGNCGHLGHKDSRCLQKSSQPRNSANSSTDQVGASLASASPSVSVPEVNPDDIVPASVTVARIDSATIPTISTPVAAVASVTGTPVVAVASVTEHVPASMAPSPTVNIGSVHVPPTSVSTTVIEAMEALPISSDATLKSTSVSDGLVLTSSPTSFVEILPTTTESEPSTPATIFKATATPSSKSALAENAPLNTDHETSLEDFPATGSVFLTPPPEASSDILPSTSGGLSFTPFTGDCTGYFNEYEMAQRSRHGRQLKPSQKVQDMQWHTVRGRKSRGCRGRGRHGDQN
ncbi:hypothetical protein Bca4012_028087 [Brassica carinata]